MGILKDRNIVVTGGSQGIGLAVACKCAREGANVIISARSSHDLTDALSKLKEAGSGEHASYVVDVSNLSEVKDFAKWCKTHYRNLHGIVHAAGIYGPIGKLTEIDMTKFTEAININLLGTAYVCHELIPSLASETRKKVVLYGGGGGSGAFAMYSAYACSKVGIVRLTENLALELQEEGVDVNCIAPGFVLTRLHKQTLDVGPGKAGAFYENTKKQYESGGVSPEKAADLTVFLLSSDSDGITGKYFSAPWDPWQDSNFINDLREDRDLCTIRRIDNQMFQKIKKGSP